MKNPAIAVIDYDIGNLASMLNALAAIGAEALPTRDPARIAEAQAVILPGVGAYRQGMDNLRKYRLIEPLTRQISRGRPFLGVCLGMQLLMEESEEFGACAGLGVVKGSVKKLAVDPDSRDKLPHIGWNAIREPRERRWAGSILEGAGDGSDMYFVHSYATVPSDGEVVLSETDFGGHRFCSSLKQGAVYGCQFHLEKSGAVGLSLLKRFAALASE